MIELTVENLTYPSENSCFSNVSFTLRLGEKIALIGPSGAGKTRLAFLLAGYPLNDAVTIKNTNRHLHQEVLLITQESEFYRDTVENNIRLGDALDLILVAKSRFTTPLDRMITDNGLQLSGGEKQRLALARAFHMIRRNNPSVIILDESLSALDPSLKKELITTIVKDYPDKILLFIIHEPALLPMFDRVILLNDNRIAFDGTYDELCNSVEYKTYLKHECNEDSELQ